jgi:hypothetical protein
MKKWVHKIPFQKVIPWGNVFEIHTHLSKQVVLERLKENTAWKPMYLYFVPPSQAFVGKVGESGFDLKESVGYTNALLPVFHGRFVKNDHGVRLRVKASNILTTFAILWGWVWAIRPPIKELSGLLHGLSGSALLHILLSSGGPAGISILITILYWRKVKDGRKELANLLRAEVRTE